MNEELTRKNFKEDVQKALFLMQKDRAPGLYGFQASFFQANWEIVGPNWLKKL